MAQRPRNITAVARPKAPTAFTPIPAPRMTMAVFIYHSGRAASFKDSANLGMKLLMNKPTRRAMIRPDSPVSFKDQVRPNFLISPGVLAAILA